MPPENNLQRLSDTLELEIDAVNKLAHALKEEYEAACISAVAKLEHAVKNKQECLGYLEDLEQDRIALVDSMGFDSTKSGMDDCLLAVDANGEVAALWIRLLSLANRCREQNRKNSLLVEAGSSYTRQALRVLRGEDPEQRLYGPNGDTSDDHDNRSLAFV